MRSPAVQASDGAVQFPPDDAVTLSVAVLCAARTGAGLEEESEQDWKRYTVTLLVFNLAGFILLYLTLRTQRWLPLNPQDLPNLKPDLAFNTAVGFMTNTNWQSYSGETTMSHFSQMVGVTFQNFVSAAVGIAVLVALIRGLARHSAKTLGNFWVDLVRANLYVLLPLSLVMAVFLTSQGVIQNFHSYRERTTLAGAKQVLGMGPVASQVAIKQLGTNGGGFFAVNSAHPFENPTACSNLVEIVAILLIPAGLVYMYGRMVGSTRHGWVVPGANTILLCAGERWAGGLRHPETDCRQHAARSTQDDRAV